GPHSQKVKADEVDLIPWVITQEALSIPQTKNGVNSSMILGSTSKFAQGPMQRLIDDNEATVFAWCAWEVMEPFPTDPNMQKRIYDAIERKFGNLDILPKDLTRFTGYYKWKDFIAKIKSLDVETLRTQWFCEKPDSTGLVYPHFDEVLNTDTAFVLDTVGDYKSLQIWEDFGYAKDHPDSVALVQVDYQRMEFTQFAELSLVEMETQNIVIEVIIKMVEKKVVADELCVDVSTDEAKETLRTQLKAMHNYSQYFTKVRLWIPDYHGLTEIADRQSMGCPIPTPAKITHESVHPGCTRVNCPVKEVSKLYLKENGIPHVRNFIDERKGKITPECIETRSQFMSYSRKRLANGKWS
ncbi:MAG: hypothetical protein KGI08_11375, partial [Thaumarchaeota archaeon]|nr:hypothetical protein [Nitrososphaerota archaeon]